MEALIYQFASHMPYLILVGVILLSGLGLPLPEDIPIIIGGYLCGTDPPLANPWLMFPALLFSIVGADGIVFWLGRRYGHHVPKLPVLRRYLTEQRLAKTESMLHAHGGKFIFMARFLPGLRAPAMFTAGTFKVPYWKFLLYDGSAALLSVPLIFFLAYFFAHRIDQVKEWAFEWQLGLGTTAAVVIVLLVLFKVWLRRRAERAGRAERPAEPTASVEPSPQANASTSGERHAEPRAPRRAANSLETPE